MHTLQCLHLVSMELSLLVRLNPILMSVQHSWLSNTRLNMLLSLLLLLSSGRGSRGR